MPTNPVGGTLMLESSMVVATIPVTDLDRAKRFYAETLGLTMLWENPASVRFSAGAGTELSIFRRGPSTADHTLAHFEVSDVEGVVRELEQRGVSFIDYSDGPLQTTGHIAQIGPARGAWLRDPDGNILGLRQA
ncbi:MAG: VOC family protein [Candidatus Dormibacteraeota bacterium]|nr:VOC family protein [Candidatus Dormibacteraeota bacterium]